MLAHLGDEDVPHALAGDDFRTQKIHLPEFETRTLRDREDDLPARDGIAHLGLGEALTEKKLAQKIRGIVRGGRLDGRIEREVIAAQGADQFGPGENGPALERKVPGVLRPRRVRQKNDPRCHEEKFLHRKRRL